MHKRAIHQFIVIMTFAQSVGWAQQISTARNEVDLKIAKASQSIQSKKKLQDQLSNLAELKLELKSIINQKKDYQGPADELYLTQTMAVFDLIPTQKFDLKKCGEYKNNLLAQFEPKAPQSKPTVNYLVKPFSILEKICDPR